MKHILLSLSFLISIACSAQVTTNVLSGYDPISGRPGYKVYDTTRTIYYQSPLYTDGDTVKTSGGGQWTLKGSNIYNNNSGKVGINDSVPTAQLEIVTPANTTTLNDTTGIILSTPFASTSSQYKSPGTILFKPTGWNTTTSASVSEYFHIGAKGTSGAGGYYPNIFFETSKDGITYLPVFHTVATLLALDGALTGINASFTSSVTSNTGFQQGTNSFLYGNNFNAGGTGQTTIGNIPTYPYPEAIFQVTSNSQGILLPVLTTLQRDSMGMQVTSLTIVTPGTGYTSPPAWNVSGNGNGITAGTGVAFGTGTLTATTVTGYTITKPGTFISTVQPTVHPFTGGGGSGATYRLNFIQVLHEGLTIYNSDIHAVQYWDGTSWNTIGGAITGTAAPVTTPVRVGQQFIDTTNKKIYVATGTSSSSDWTILN